MQKPWFFALTVILAALAYFFGGFLSVAAYAAVLLSVYLLFDSLLFDSLGTIERMMLSLFSSVVFFVWLAFGISSIVGYGRLSITLSLLALGAISAFFTPAETYGRLVLGKFFHKSIGAAVEHKNALFLALFVFLLVFYIMAQTLWVPSREGIVVGGWNYGDFFFHLPIILSVNAGNFPPQAPYLAGAPLAYHWFSDFFTAINAKITGWDAIGLVRLENALWVSLFFLCVYFFAFELCAERKKSVYAALVVLFAGGLGFTKIFADLSSSPDSGLLTLISSKAYDNDWAAFQVPSLLPGFLLDQRPIMIGLPVFVLILLLVLSAKRNRNPVPSYALAGALAGLSPMFHIYSGLFGALFAGIFILSETWRGKRIRRANAMNAACFALPFLVLLAPSYFLLSSTGSKMPIVQSFGWLAPKDLFGFINFYWNNLGVSFAFFAIFFIASYFSKKNAARVDSSVFFVVCFFGAFLFAVPNLFVTGGVEWDMAKFFAFLWVPAGVISALGVIEIAEKLPRPAAWAILVAFFIISSLSSILTVAWWMQNRWIGLDGAQVAAGEWIAKNTPPGSVFVAAGNHNSPIDTVGVRYRVIGYDGSGWLNAIGGLNFARRAFVQKAYCGSADESALAARGLNATYVFYGPVERQNYQCNGMLESNAAFRKVYSNSNVEIYKLET